MTYTKRCYLNAKTALTKARWMQFFVFCWFAVLIMFASMLGYILLYELPFTIMYILFNFFGYMIIGGVGCLLFNEYKLLSNYIKQLKQKCKEYKLKLVELKENIELHFLFRLYIFH